MVIKPWGYRLWENMQRALDDMFKATGHQNAYFPLFISDELLWKRRPNMWKGSQKNVRGRHPSSPGTRAPMADLRPAGKLEEPLIVRPTSETIIGATYAKWVQSSS